MRATKYTHSTQLRGYKVMKALFGHEATGITLTVFAKQLGMSTSALIKDLKTLEEAGLAEQLPDESWRISPLLGRETVKIMNSFNDARRRLEETANRYGVGS